jgi:hypothetical protein
VQPSRSMVRQTSAASKPRCRHQERAQPAGVVEGREDGADVVRPQLPAHDRVVAVPDDHPVRQHDALGLARGARGVEQAPEVLRIAPLPRPGPVGQRGDEVARGDEIAQARVPGLDRLVEGHPAIQRNQSFEGAHRLGLLGAVEDAGGERVREDAGQLARSEPGSEGHQDHAGLGRGEVGVDVLDPVVGQQGEAVSFFDPQDLAPDAGDAHGASVEVAVGEPLARGDVDQGGPVRGEAGALAQEVARDHLKFRRPGRRPPRGPRRGRSRRRPRPARSRPRRCPRACPCGRAGCAPPWCGESSRAWPAPSPWR